MANVVRQSFGLNPGQPFPIYPFRLDNVSPLKPSKFHMQFIMENVHWDYSFALTTDRVVEERLFHYPKGKPAKVFERLLDRDGYGYTFGTSAKRLSGITDKTRENALFVSTCAQFDQPIMRGLVKWFSNIRDIDSKHAMKETLEMIHRLQEYGKTLHPDWLQAADLGISGVKVEEGEGQRHEESRLNPVFVSEEMQEARILLEKTEEAIRAAEMRAGITHKELKAKILHKMLDSEEDAAFDLNDESAGTIQFLAMLGPWANSMALGSLLLIDEIDRSLHSLLSGQLLNGWNHSVISKGAQLLVTTHDTTLLDLDIFRRDQIWFTEKDEAGATTLYSLSDFHPRAGEAIQKGYLAGRYGAIPVLGANLGFNEIKA